MKFFTKTTKLEHEHLLEIAASCAAAMLLIFAALFISNGGVARIGQLVATNNISPSSLTASIFPCSDFGYCYAPIVVNPGMSVSNASPTPGSTVTAYPTVSSSGSSGECYQYLWGGEYGGGWNQSGTGGDPTCLCVGGDQDGQTVACGTGGSQCDSTTPNGSTGTTYMGWTQIWTNGGPIPAWTTLPLTQGGTTYTVFNYCFFANVGYAAAGASATIVPSQPAPTCTIPSASATYPGSTSQTYTTTNATGVTYTLDGVARGAPANPLVLSGLASGSSHTVILTVTGPGGSGTCGSAGNVVENAPPAPSCTLTTLANNTTGNYSYATLSYTTANAVSATYQVDSGTAITPANNPFNITGLSAGTHNVLMTVTNSVGATATCPGTITTSAVGVPTVSVTAGGASSVTIPVNATTTLAWSTTNANPGATSLTAPSNSATVTNFATVSSNTYTSYYFPGYVAAGGYVYQFGGYNSGTSLWTNTVFRAPVGADLTTVAWTNMGTLATGATGVGGSINQPVILNNTAYLFGGYITGTGYTYNICSVPVANIGTVGSWTCPTTLPQATNVAQAITPTLIIGNYLYRIGGYNSVAGSSVASVARASLSSPTSWINFPNVLPAPVYGSAEAVIGNYVYVFGGYNTSLSTPGPVATIYRALITSDLTNPASWSSGGSLPAANADFGVAVDGSNVYLLGGYLTGGVSSNAINKLPVASLAAGGVLAGSWTSAGTIPVAIYPAIPFIVENNLYIGGGYNNVSASYTNKLYSVPFNDGLAYTTPANTPWFTDGGNNMATTWPLTVNSVTYTLSATNVSGTTVGTAVVNEPDLCTNAPFTGIQNPLPTGVTAVGTTCTCTTGTWNGSACIASSPIISTPTISPLLTTTLTLVRRIQKGNSITLNWSVAGLTSGDAATSCSVSSNPPSAMTTQTWNHSGITWTQVNNPISPITINGTTVFTVSCTNAAWSPTTVSTSATVNLVPVFQEQ